MEHQVTGSQRRDLAALEPTTRDQLVRGLQDAISMHRTIVHLDDGLREPRLSAEDRAEHLAKIATWRTLADALGHPLDERGNRAGETGR
jgi:hypothetical protein